MVICAIQKFEVTFRDSPDLLPRVYLNPRPGGVPDHLAPEALMVELVVSDFRNEFAREIA